MQKVFIRLVALIALSIFSISSNAAPQFLNFPVSGYGPYTSGVIISALDHNVSLDLTKIGQSTGPYGYDGAVLSFTGELFVATSQYPTNKQGCYPKPANLYQTATWSATLSNAYVGTGSGTTPPTLCTKNNALNYDNHPGYDYAIPQWTAVYPAYAGNIIFTECINTFGGTCAQYGAIAVDHGNGFVTQYLHMAYINYGVAANGQNQPVTTSWILGQVSNVGAPGGPHLHFEVLQRKATPVNPNSYYDPANYVVVDPYGYKTSSPYADNLSSKPGCLWAVGCQY